MLTSSLWCDISVKIRVISMRVLFSASEGAC